MLGHPCASVKYIFGLRKVRAAEVRVAEVRAAEVRAAEVRAAEVRAAEVRAAEVRVAEVRAAEVRVAEVRAAEVRAAEVRAAEVRAAEVRAAEVRAAEVRAAEVRVAELQKSVFFLYLSPNHFLQSFYRFDSIHELPLFFCALSVNAILITTHGNGQMYIVFLHQSTYTPTHKSNHFIETSIFIYPSYCASSAHARNSARAVCNSLSQ